MKVGNTLKLSIYWAHGMNSLCLPQKQSQLNMWAGVSIWWSMEAAQFKSYQTIWNKSQPGEWQDATYPTACSFLFLSVNPWAESHHSDEIKEQASSYYTFLLLELFCTSYYQIMLIISSSMGLNLYFAINHLNMNFLASLDKMSGVVLKKLFACIRNYYFRKL